MKYENLNILWASILIEEFLRNGIDYFCVCSGFRSSPLLTAIARNKKARSIICYDERGASFHALGFARACGRPAVVVTTSGTAVANCFPAVIEASMDCIPLVIISADRPPELQDTRANQTIEQYNIFGGYVRYFFNIPSPELSMPPQMLLTTVDQAIYRSLTYPKGPVHLNFMFREPLIPEKKSFSSDYLLQLKKWIPSKQPHTVYKKYEMDLSDQEIILIADIINNAKCGLIVLGSINIQQKDPILKLINKIDWPVFSDIRSNIFSCLNQKIIEHFSLLLSSFIPEISFDVILHIGGSIVSKHFYQLLKKTKPSHYIVVKEDPFRQDESHISTLHIQADIGRFCEALIPYLKAKKNPFLDNLIDASLRIKEILEKKEVLSEAALLYSLSKHVPDNSNLFLSNSMPIRYADMYAEFKKKHINIGANRGASGIDGIIATASGFAEATKKLTTLVIGDLAFIHDLNSLFLLNKIHAPLIIILINNNGGGIFSLLPARGFPEILKYFVAPHNLESFEGIANFFGFPYFSSSDINELLDKYLHYVKNEQTAILEFKIDKEKSACFHRHVQDEIKRAISRCIG